ncbi:hypothetical protein D9M71_313110 [compost metagenome]
MHLRNLVVAGQPLVESLDQITALIHRNGRDVILPVVGEHAAGARLVEPLDFLWPAQEDPTQDQAMHTLGVGLGIGQGQGRTPGATEQHPFFDAQVLAGPLQVFDQVPGGVVFQAGVGGRTTAATLIESDDAVQVGIKVATALGITTSARAAVNEHHRQTFRRATLIDIQHMRLFHGQIVPGVRFDLRVQSLHCALRRVLGHPCWGLLLNCRPAS